MNLLHWPTSISARFALAVSLYLVQTGNKEPGPKLLTSVLLVLFLVPMMLALPSGLETFGGITILAAGCLLLLGASIHALAIERPAWRVLPEEEPWRTIALGGYAIAFFFPFWGGPIGFLRGLFLSPLGPLPQQTLLALLILCASSGRHAPSLLSKAALAAGLLLGINDLAVGNQLLGIMVLAGTAALAGRMIHDVMQQQQPHEEEPTLSFRDEPEKGSAQEEPAGRKWDIR